MGLVKIEINEEPEDGVEDIYPIGSYARIVGLDTAPMNLELKQFLMELSINETARNERGVFYKPSYRKLELAEEWSLEITMDTTVAQITAEAYRAAKVVYPEYATIWQDSV